MNGDSHENGSTDMKDVKLSAVIDGLLDQNHPKKRPRSNSLDPVTSPPPESSTIPKPSTWNEHLVEVARAKYRDFLIPIYGEINYDGRNSNRRFYFEPIVLLDPQSVLPVTFGLLKQKSVRFSIQMWNDVLLSQVQKSLSSIFTGVRKENIYAMPYEEVQLQADLVGHPFSLMEKPTAYNRQDENLVFYLLCNSPSAAATLASDLRHNPDFSLQNLPMQLECRGLVLRNSAGMERPSFTFDVASLPPTEKSPILNGLVPRQPESTGSLKDLDAQIVAMSNNKSTDVEPISSALKGSNSEPAEEHSSGNAALEIETKKEQGSFNLPTGILGMKTAVNGWVPPQPQSADLEGRLKDLDAQIFALSNNKSTDVVPVSAALKGANSEPAEGHLFDYPALEFVMKGEHENFDRSARIFGGKTAVNGLVPQLRSTEIEERLKDLEAQIVALSKKKSTNVVPVFSAFQCANSEEAEGHSIGYADLDFETKEEHGSFHLPTGIFSVKTAGIYQFNFSGHVATNRNVHFHCFTIRVDGNVKAVFYSLTPTSEEWNQPVSLSALLPLKSGEKVGVYLGVGKLDESFPQFITRFSGILLSKS